MLKLRDYQTKDEYLVRKSLAKNKRVILCEPTGSGKTIIATSLIIKAIDKGFIAAFLCDRLELINQALKELIKHVPNIQIINKETKTILPSKLYVCMVETFYRRASRNKIPTKIDILFIDEGHMGNYFKVLDMYPDAMVISLTATPVSSAANNPLKKYYNDIVVGPSVSQLCREGWLVPSIDIGHNKILQLKIENGEFSGQSQILAFKKYNIDRLMLEAWQKLAIDRQTICFCINVEHSKKVCKMFQDIGIQAEHVDSSTDKDERRRVTGIYKKGLIQVLCNVGIYTKGFDDKATSCIILDKSTASTTFYYQMVGRGGRPHEGKKDFIVIDMGNNVLRHGSYNDPMDWKALFLNDERDKNFKVKYKYKVCPICYLYIRNKFVISCSQCGNNFEQKPMLEIEDIIPENLRKDTNQMTFKELNDYGKIMNFKRGWAFMQRFGRKNTFSNKR